MPINLKADFCKLLSLFLKTEIRHLLWTNSSPTSSFSPQTLSIDASGYDFLEIEARYSTGTNETYHISRIPVKGVTYGSFIAPQGEGRGMSARKITYGTNNLSIGKGTIFYSTTETSDNNACVPTKIYGIRTTKKHD